MADIVRAATPITNKNIVQPLREHKNADLAPFDIQDPTRVATVSYTHLRAHET